MDGMRFNNQSNREVSRDIPNNEPVAKVGIGIKTTVKKVFKFLFLILIPVVLLGGGFLLFNKTKSRAVLFDSNASPYYAVFLTNDQVYFGKPILKDNNDFILEDVYYLRASEENALISQQESVSSPRFTLIKLGQEVHGPTDRLFINNKNILFYEQLTNESQVVKSINEAKIKN